MTKQGVPWLEIVLRENENEKDVIVGGRVKSGEKNGSNGSKRVKGGVDFFKRKKTKKRERKRERRGEKTGSLIVCGCQRHRRRETFQRA